MADPTIEKTDDGYRMTDGARSVPISTEDFEDLYFSDPNLNTSQFYRLLTDSVCKNDDQRLNVRGMVEESDLGLNDALRKLQQDIQALPDPTA